MGIPLAVIEQIVDAPGTAPLIDDLLPAGVRHRQLSTRTLLAGMMLALADGRPTHLTRVLQALVALPEDDQIRLGVTENAVTGRTSSPTAKSSTPPGSSDGRWTKTSPTAHPDHACSRPATS